MTTPNPQDKIQHLAHRLWDAGRTRQPIPPIRTEIGSGDIRTAYEVQEVLTLRRLRDGCRVVGRKIGLTSAAVQHQLGVDQPDFGMLFDDMERTEDDRIETWRLINPKVEAELAFVLADDLCDDELEVDTVRAGVEYVVPALEIVDSRIQDWDISIVDTVADNASSALFVLGAERRGIEDVEPADVEMELTANGRQVSSGTGRSCLGDPLAAVLWLARTCRDLGLPLRAGEIVLSGALGPMVPVDRGIEYRAHISALGTVRARFA